MPGEHSSTLPTWNQAIPKSCHVQPLAPTPATPMVRLAHPTRPSGQPILGVPSARSCGYRDKCRACPCPQVGHIWDKPGLKRSRTPLQTCPRFDIWFLWLVHRAYCGGCSCGGNGQEDLGEQLSGALLPCPPSDRHPVSSRCSDLELISTSLPEEFMPP